jgi:peptide/nickel transport system permease protein
MVGILLIACFSVSLGWFPSFGRGEVVHLGPWWTTGFLTGSGLRALVLPSITLSVLQMAMILRLVRAEMLRARRADYIISAKARGLANYSIYFKHALRNALAPLVTITGLQLGVTIAFSMITETVFQWPGLGLLFVQSVQNADIPVISAYLMLTGVGFVLINLAVDLCYQWIDPRLRASRRLASA